MTLEEAANILDRRTTIPGDGYTYEQINGAIDLAIAALRTVSREQVEKVWRGEWIAVREAVGGYKCSRCKAEAVLDCNDEFVLDNFCPRCGAAMTDEAVEITMRRLGGNNNG